VTAVAAMGLRLTLASAQGRGQPASVGADGGKVWYRPAGGRPNEARSIGPGFDPSLTASAAHVVYCRRAETADEGTDVLWHDVASGGETRLLQGGFRWRGVRYRNLGQPRASREGKELFVLAEHSVTTGSLFRVDLTKGAVTYIAEAVRYEVLACAGKAPTLFVVQRQAAVDHTYFYLTWRYSFTGKNLGLAGPETLDVTRLAGCQRW
jgi:hypothetical protein